jgi:molybdopterin-guanine dinucleotide biosynthesis protein A
MAEERDLPFTAALIAGGKSTRMGRDKCLLEFDGQPLWKRQISVLQELHPAEIIISGRSEQIYFQESTARFIPDQWPNAGPLGGIASVLESASYDMVLVLAVDMPQMNTTVLQHLVSHASSGKGVVFKHGDFHEPLAAIYPKSLISIALHALTNGELRLQDWVNAGIHADSLKSIQLPQLWEPNFANLNSTLDLPRSDDFQPPHQ